MVEGLGTAWNSPQRTNPFGDQAQFETWLTNYPARTVPVDLWFM